MPSSAALEVERPVVLFIDDDSNYLRSIRAAAESEVEVRTEESSVGGLKKARAEQVSAVVTDQRMSSMTGVTVLEQIHAAKPDLPLALHSGFQLTPEEKLRLRQIGALEIPKGTRVQDLLGTLLKSRTRPRGTEDMAAENLRLKARIAEDREFITALLSDVRAQLDQIPNPAALKIRDGGESFSVAELIADIESQNPRGREFVLWWLEARRTLRSLGKVIK